MHSVYDSNGKWVGRLIAYTEFVLSQHFFFHFQNQTRNVFPLWTYLLNVCCENKPFSVPSVEQPVLTYTIAP